MDRCIKQLKGRLIFLHRVAWQGKGQASSKVKFILSWEKKTASNGIHRLSSLQKFETRFTSHGYINSHLLLHPKLDQPDAILPQPRYFDPEWKAAPN